MKLQSYLHRVGLLLAFAGILSACSDVADADHAGEENTSTESGAIDSTVDGQGDELVVGNVNFTVRTDRFSFAPGENVAITGTFTSAVAGWYEIRASVVRPDGVRADAGRWSQYLFVGRPLTVESTYRVDALARAGFYSISVAITPQGKSTQSVNGTTAFSVTSGAVSPPPPTPGNTGNGLRISGRHLIDGTGRIFTARGPELVTASLEQLGTIDAIAASGANSMRMLLTLDTANNMTPQAFDQLLGRAVSKKLVVWISLFTWDNSRSREIAPALGGGHLAKMSDYLVVWQRQWLKDLIKKYDGWVVVDAMQEFKSSIQPPEDPRAVREWVDAAKQHVRFFRQQGFTQPLEVMTSFEGRDLAAIVKNADEILATDTLLRNNSRQTMFGWQAYWGTDFYRGWQGGQLVGRSMTASEAVTQFVMTRNYPIQVGLDSIDIPGSESYGTLMPTCSSSQVSWLWWEWNELVQAGHGATVRTSRDGFAGAIRASN